MQSAQAILRTSSTPLAKWGKRLLASKGHRNIAVAAVARRLSVAIWYLMMGRWTPLEEVDQRLQIKISKMLSEVTSQHLEKSGRNRKQWKLDILQKLKSTRVYLLDPNRRYAVSQVATT